MKLERLVEGYRLYCQAESKSSYTIRWYIGKIRIFLQYLHNGGHSTEAEGLSAETIRAFVVYLQQSARADVPTSSLRISMGAPAPKRLSRPAIISWR
ncbi:MAG: hypothetical protein ACE5LG_00320 [Anaerolineae bacterium]